MADTRALQVKQHVAVIRSPQTGQRFAVFETGDPRSYLFCQLYPGTLTQTGLSFPVAKRDIVQPYRSALAHGWGNDA